MEPAGLAIGLVGMFSACMDIWDRVDAFRDADKEQRQVYVRLQAEKFRLRKWGDEVGLANGELNDLHDVRLDDSRIRSLVEKVLFSVGEALEPNDEKLSQMRIEFKGRDAFSVFGAASLGNKSKGSQKQSLPRSKIDGLAWALRRKGQLTIGVDDVKKFVDILYDLIPLDKNTGLTSKRQMSGLTDNDKGNFEFLQVLRPNLWHRDAVVQKQKAIDEWLGLSKLAHSYEEYLESHLVGTCDWILSSPSYMAWISNDFQTDAAKVLWIHGPPGYGKTILCAHLVHTLRKCNQCSVAYFFASDLQAGEKLDSIVRRWLAQLVRADPNACELLLGHVRRDTTMNVASQADVWSAFESTVSQGDRYIFTLDGLDEYKREDDNRRRFLQKLKGCLVYGRHRVLVTSRGEIDIKQELSSESAHHTGLSLHEHKIVPEDVRCDASLFAKDVVERNLPKKDPKVQQDIAERMAKKCDGMFLWIKLQQGQLSGSKSHLALRRRIANMPSELSGTYERNWNAISTRPPEDRERAVEILAWAVYAFRPLSIAELAEALSIGAEEDDLEASKSEISDGPDEFIDGETFDIDEDYVNKEILDACGSLVEARDAAADDKPAARTVHLVHFSVKEFLHSLASRISPSDGLAHVFGNEAQSHLRLAKLCIQYLNREGICSEGDSSNGGAFFHYASASWHLHIQKAGDKSEELKHLVAQFLDPLNANFDVWRRHFEYVVEKPESDETRALSPPSLPIYYAALLDMTWAMQLFKRDQDLNKPNKYDWTPLSSAAHSGFLEVVKLLLDKGADSSIASSRGWTPLNSAADEGHLDVVRLLLDNGADISTTSRDGWTP
ncbi:hypothetical protein K431DRAFT_192823, partial [Polychaeton citri CBS 116435]